MFGGYQRVSGVPEAGQGVGEKDSPCLTGQLVLLLLCSQHEKNSEKPPPKRIGQVVEPPA